MKIIAMLLIAALLAGCAGQPLSPEWHKAIHDRADANGA